MEAILDFVILLIVFFSFVNLKIGVAIYLAYLMLVPYMQIHLGGLTLSYNLINLIFFIAFFIEFRFKNKYKIDYKPFIPFFLLYMGYFILMFFSDGAPFSYMFDQFRQHVMKIFILSFVMWNVILNDHSSLKLFRNIALTCIAIASIYGIYLTQTEGLNPYIMFLANMAGEEFNIEYATRETGRMFGRISSVFVHPMGFGLFLGLGLIYIFSCMRKINKYVLLFLFIVTLINVFTCGVRSVIAGLGISVLIYLLLIRRFKVIIVTSIMIAIIFGIISTIPEMSDYVLSIVDPNSSKIGGSSLDMRINQFLACFDIISTNPLFGKGFEWHQYYIHLRGTHPKLFAFESLIYVVLCNYGFLGVILWIFFISKMIKYLCSLGKIKEILIALSIFIFYLGYSCITGEYGYMQVFILFYILIIADIYVSHKPLESK